MTDEEILFAYRYLAREEGIFCEPASAAAMAGVFKLLREGRLEPESTVVLTLTGHGLKDPATAERVAELPPPVPARPRRWPRPRGFCDSLGAWPSAPARKSPSLFPGPTTWPGPSPSL